MAGIFPWAIRGSITKLAFAILVPDHVAAVRPAAELAFPLPADRPGTEVGHDLEKLVVAEVFSQGSSAGM